MNEIRQIVLRLLEEPDLRPMIVEMLMDSGVYDEKGRLRFGGSMKLLVEKANRIIRE